jgi:hypothetical protein
MITSANDQRRAHYEKSLLHHPPQATNTENYGTVGIT